MENQNQGENPKLSTEKIADIARGLDKKQFKAEDIVNAYVEMDGGLFSGVDVDKLKKTVGGRIGEDINKKKGEHLFRRCKNKKGGNMRGGVHPCKEGAASDTCPSVGSFWRQWGT